jgi:hypothetical protein
MSLVCGHQCKKLRGFACLVCDETPKTKPVPNVKTIPEQIPERVKIEPE